MFDCEITTLLNQALNFDLLTEESLKAEFLISKQGLDFWRHGALLPEGSYRRKLIKMLKDLQPQIEEKKDQMFVSVVNSLVPLAGVERICQHFEIPSSTLADWRDGRDLPNSFMRGRVCGFFDYLDMKEDENERPGIQSTDQ